MAEVHSNRSEHDRRFERAVEKALRLVGGQGERIAKETITEMGAVDTGLLRNSITFAIGGGPANATEYASDSGATTGAYEGEMPSDHGGDHTVYIGTNVYYAPYVEFGTRKMAARPFLSQGVMGSRHELEQVFQEAFAAFM